MKYLFPMNDKQKIDKLRHSCSHILASAVKKLYPGVKLGIGPATDTGFYYDFDFPSGFNESGLSEIEKVMREEIKQNLPFVREEWSREEAAAFFEREGQPYKLELIKDLGQEKVSIYRHGGFTDLCKGPHLDSTGEVKHFKLLSTAGAYWRGKEENPQLVRIYGAAFFTKEELTSYLKHLEEAKQRDHRKLGPALRLFDIYHDQAGAGLVFYLEKGALLKRIIEDWEIKEHLKRGYLMVSTPHVLESKLWEKSGHLDYYRDLMFLIGQKNVSYAVKPMNCPGHMLIYKSKTHSYRDLPLRMFELGTVYRREKSGVLHGLLRLRGFTQDDAHIFCRQEQLASEIKGVLIFIKEAMLTFGFTDFQAEISTRPESFIGEEAVWDKAEKILAEILRDNSIDYKTCSGEGAFYGPKIDIKLKDALGREWQCATVQLDFFLPGRFDLSYIDEKGKKQVPVMIHRVILGSLERFMATLIEHYKGAFPFWLAPVQVKVLSLKSICNGYAEEVRIMLSGNFRTESDIREETLSKKIRESEMEKIPYLFIVGEKEKESRTVNIRSRGRKQVGTFSLSEALAFLNKEEKH